MVCQDHLFRILHDPEAIKKGFLCFYCQKCLLLIKIKKEYFKDAEKQEVKKDIKEVKIKNKPNDNRG
jgi:hypothetical protein